MAGITGARAIRCSWVEAGSTASLTVDDADRVPLEREPPLPCSAVARGRVVALLLALAASVSATGCTVGGSERDAAPAIPEEELVEPGALTACTDATRPPLEYRGQDGVLRGFEVELVDEIADRLGLQPVWLETSRAEVGRALVAGRCDVAASTLAVRRDLGGRLAPFATTAYLSVPLSLLVRNGERPLAVAGLCGLRVGVFSGTREEDVLGEYGDVCSARGRPALEMVGVAGTPGVLALLRAGRLDAVLAEHPVNEWFARRQTDRFDLAWVLGDEVVRWAIGTRPGRNGVFSAVRSELRDLERDGTFRMLLERWALDRTGAVLLPFT